MREALARRGPFRILVWAQLRLAPDLLYANDEIRWIMDLEARSRCVVDVQVDRFWTDLPGAVESFQPDIVHFIGHGKRGALLAIDVDETGMPAERKVSPRELLEAFRKPPMCLSGVFLNGCDTAHWAPHFVPNGGWLIGTNKRLSDDAGAFFAPRFYEYLVDGMSDGDAFDRAYAEIAGMVDGESAPLVRWVEDPDPEDFLSKVFSRQGFLTPVSFEGSLLDLGEAIGGVRQSLSKGALATRAEMPGSSTIYCRGPLDPHVVARLMPRLTAVDVDYRQLRNGFPDVVRYADAWMEIPSASKSRLLELADRLDRSRNELLRTANDHLPDRKRLPLMAVSSSADVTA